MKGPGETLNNGVLSYFPEKNATMEHHIGLQKIIFFFQLSLSLVFGWIRIRICGSNSWADMNPLRRFGPLFHTFLLASFVSYLVTNSICKLFVDVLFNHNITFLSNDKNKQPFCSSSAAFIIASRTVYSRIKCETTAFEPLKLLQYILASSDANQHWYETS